MGIGSVCDSLEMVWLSFSEAKEQINDSIKMGTDEFPVEIIGNLATSIMDNNKHATKKHAIKLQDVITGKTDNIEDYRTSLLELSILLKQKNSIKCK